MQQENYLSTLSIEKISLQCHLGSTPEEKKEKQEILVDITIDFQDIPQACESDKPSHSCDYKEMCNTLEKLTADRQFDTIEYLSSQLLYALDTFSTPETYISIDVHQVKSPIKNIKGGVRFLIEPEV